MRKLLTKLNVFMVAVMSCVLLSGCFVPKKIEHTETVTTYRDSVSIERIQVVDSVKVESRSLTSLIPIDSLMISGIFKKHLNGIQKTVTVKDSVIIVDCLFDEFYHYFIQEFIREFELQYRDESFVQKTEITKEVQNWKVIFWLSMTIVGLILFIIIIIHYGKGKIFKRD